MTPTRLARIAGHALRAVWAYPTSACFSVLAVALAICVVSLTEAATRGANAKIEEFVQWFGADAAFVAGGEVRGKPVGQRNETITMADWRAIRDGLPGVHDVSASRLARRKTFKYGSRTHETPALVGAMPGFTRAWNWSLALGRDIEPEDEAVRARVCLLGEIPRRALFADENPLGRQVRLDGQPYTVIGVLSERGFVSGGVSVDDRVVVPLSSLTRHYNLNPLYLRGIRLKFADASDMDANIAELRRFLRRLHGLGPGQEDDFTVVTIQEIFNFLSVLRVGIQLFLVVTSAVVIAAAGFTAANLAYLNISLRRVEIGLLMAVGATRRDIVAHIVLELLILDLAGAVLGYALGEAACWLVNRQGLLVAVATWRTFALALGLGLAVTLVFGLRPALAAAAMQPDQALRA